MLALLGSGTASGAGGDLLWEDRVDQSSFDQAWAIAVDDAWVFVAGGPPTSGLRVFDFKVGKASAPEKNPGE